MNNVMEIKDDVVYVRGISRGAIYNLNDGKVYSINADACKLLDGYLADGTLKDGFLGQLKEMALIEDGYDAREYIFPALQKEPSFAWLELTEVCNLRCAHCYVGDKHRDNHEECLSVGQWKDVIRQLREVKCKKIEFIGGEPTIYPHFEELLEFAVSIGHSVDIYSNLQAFSDKLLRFVKKHDIVVHFSIYGSSGKTHDTITRKKGSFKKLVYWVGRLLENRIRVVPAVTIMRQNQDDILNTISLMKSMGIPMERMSIDTVRATACRDIHGLEVEDPEKNLALRRKPSFHVTKDFFHKAYSANTCLVGKLSIHPDGLVSPCEFSRDIVCGNVKKDSIAQILNSDILKQFWYLDFSKIEQCKYCEYRFACQDCRMLIRDIGLYKKNPRCLYDPMRGTWG